jgi:hypothetical protein
MLLICWMYDEERSTVLRYSWLIAKVVLYTAIYMEGAAKVLTGRP